MSEAPTATASPFLAHSWIYSQFELVRLFRTKRGITSLIAFTVIWYLLLRYPIYQASSLLSSQDLQQMLNSLFTAVNISHLFEWPSMELALFWLLGLFVFPIIAITISADQTASDHSRGTLRFLTLRSHRDSLLVGRFLGQLMILALMIVITTAITLLMTLWRDPATLLTSSRLAATIAVELIIVVMPFTALMSLLNCWLRSTRLSIMAVIIGFPLLQFITGQIAGYWPALATIERWLPGAQLIDLMQSEGWATLDYLGAPLLQSLCLLIIARIIFSRSAL